MTMPAVSNDIPVSIRVLAPHQRHARQAAANLLLATGLGSGNVASPNVTERNINLFRSLRVSGPVARRFQEIYLAAYLGDEMVAATRFFPDAQLALQSAEYGDLKQVEFLSLRPRLSHLAVIPQRRGQGIGSALLAAAEDHARTDSATMLWGFAEASVEAGRKPTPEENERLQRFYIRHGYRLGGDDTHAPREIFGRPILSPGFNRLGTFFWKIL